MPSRILVRVFKNCDVCQGSPTWREIAIDVPEDAPGAVAAMEAWYRDYGWRDLEGIVVCPRCTENVAQSYRGQKGK